MPCVLVSLTSLLIKSQRLKLFVRNCERCNMHTCDAGVTDIVLFEQGAVVRQVTRRCHQHPGQCGASSEGPSRHTDWQLRLQQLHVAVQLLPESC
jgi:hypothetical protein